jgi:hypothetical protein
MRRGKLEISPATHNSGGSLDELAPSGKLTHADTHSHPFRGSRSVELKIVLHEQTLKIGLVSLLYDRLPRKTRR